MAKKIKHVEFKGAVKSVEKGGYSAKEAAAIVASKSRKAGMKAKRRNPRLKKVKGK